MLKQRLDSFKYAFNGIRELIRSQPNAKIHLFLALLAIIAGFYFQVSLCEWCILTLCICSVLTAEAFNTALEYLTDLVSPEYHVLAGKVKDVAASAVLITAIAAFICGLIIFIPKIISHFL